MQITTRDFLLTGKSIKLKNNKIIIIEFRIKVLSDNTDPQNLFFV